MYLTYDEYIQYGGGLEPAAYTRLAFKADKLIDARTQNRIKDEETVSQTVKLLVFEVIKELNDAETRKAETMSSYSNDGVSVSLVKQPSEAKTAHKIEGVIFDYLVGESTSDGLPLLYLGV